MRTIAFIPVRCGSKSIPFKNIKPLCGKPLVFWSINALENCKIIDQIVVATDCAAIADIVSTQGFSKTVVYNRLPENATDTASTESVILEYIAATPTLQAEDIFLLVQATSPLTETRHFEEALSQYNTEKLDSLLSCVNTKRFFWNKNGTPKNYDFYNRPRRQDFDGEWMENGAFYVHTVGGILEHQCRLGGKVGIYEMPEYTFLELDEPHDWLMAEKLMLKHLGSGIESKTQTTQIKLFLTDVDGVLTDGSMYYTESGDELKRFHTHDGMAFELLRKVGIKTGIITSEQTEMVTRRATKLKADYLFQGKRDGGKLAAAKEICEQENISLAEVAYVGDDINCLELLQAVGLAACPANAVETIKKLPQIIQLSKKGGEGAVRELVELILQDKKS